MEGCRGRYAYAASDAGYTALPHNVAEPLFCKLIGLAVLHLAYGPRTA